MEPPHKSNSTEKIPSEDWCTECKQTVDEWNVFFEESIHTDSGYDKVRRCPHCEAKCFADGSFGVGCFLFFLGLFGAPILVFAFLRRLDVNLDLEEGGVSFGVFVGCLAVAVLFETVVLWLWKQSLYRRKPAKNDTITTSSHVVRGVDK